jgi:multidrug resistance efflux pump
LIFLKKKKLKSVTRFSITQWVNDQIVKAAVTNNYGVVTGNLLFEIDQIMFAARFLRKEGHNGT